MIMDKKTLRKIMEEKRQALTQEQAREAAHVLSERLFTSDLYAGAKNILIFVSFGKEMDTSAIIERALSDGKNVACPRISGKRQMDFIGIRSRDDLKAGSFGILEPEEGGGPVYTKGLVLAPGLAFDREFNRLGYGGGYYDVWMEKHGKGCLKYALSYDFQLIDDVPHNEKDVQLDGIITPSAILTKR